MRGYSSIRPACSFVFSGFSAPPLIFEHGYHPMSNLASRAALMDTAMEKSLREEEDVE